MVGARTGWLASFPISGSGLASIHLTFMIYLPKSREMPRATLTAFSPALSFETPCSSAVLMRGNVN